MGIIIHLISSGLSLPSPLLSFISFPPLFMRGPDSVEVFEWCTVNVSGLVLGVMCEGMSITYHGLITMW